MAAKLLFFKKNEEFLNLYNTCLLNGSNKRKEFNKLCATFTDGAYDLSIVINQKKISINYKADDLDYVLGGQTMETGVTKGKLKNALVKAGNNKMKQRVILNEFVEQMAV